MSFPSIARPRYRCRLAVMVTLTGSIIAGSVALPPASLAHRHERDACGPDVNEFASAFLSVFGPSVAKADAFEVHRESDACGRLEKKSTFVNRTDFPVEHTFRKSHSKRTEYSVQVSGGFNGAFSASLGYTADKTATEEFESKVRIPARTGVELSASPSLHVVTGTWKHGRWWNRKTTHVEVYRPTGHIKWLLREAR